MQLPRLRLPRLPFESFSAVLPGRRLLLYTGYTLLLFLVFLIAQFPHDVLVQRALHTVDLSPFQLDVAGIRFAWFRGYELRGVALTRIDDGDGVPPLLESSSLYVRPGWDGLVRGRLASVHLQAAMYSGSADGSWGMQDGIHRATLHLEDVEIGRYRWLINALQEGEIRGRLSGVLSAESRRGNMRDSELAGELELKNGLAAGLKIKGFTVPELQFSSISAKFAVKGDHLDIEELRADGPMLKVNGGGQVTMRAPLTESVLNLRVTVLPGAESDDAVKGLLALVPRPKNARPDAPMAITGTLAQPRVR